MRNTAGLHRDMVSKICSFSFEIFAKGSWEKPLLWTIWDTLDDLCGAGNPQNYSAQAAS
jgi:hypothetical protein